MTEFINKFKAIEREIADERGGIVLFGLFEREDLPGKWDVVISAPWVRENWPEALDYVIGIAHSRLTREEIISVSKYVLLRPSEEFVRELNKIVHVEHGLAELRDLVVNGMAMTRAYVITSRPQDGAEPPPEPAAP
jgi:hypothetical protein